MTDPNTAPTLDTSRETPSALRNEEPAPAARHIPTDEQMHEGRIALLLWQTAFLRTPLVPTDDKKLEAYSSDAHVEYLCRARMIEAQRIVLDGPPPSPGATLTALAMRNLSMLVGETETAQALSTARSLEEKVRANQAGAFDVRRLEAGETLRSITTKLPSGSDATRLLSMIVAGEVTDQGELVIPPLTNGEEPERIPRRYIADRVHRVMLDAGASQADAVQASRAVEALINR